MEPEAKKKKKLLLVILVVSLRSKTLKINGLEMISAHVLRNNNNNKHKIIDIVGLQILMTGKGIKEYIYMHHKNKNF